MPAGGATNSTISGHMLNPSILRPTLALGAVGEEGGVVDLDGAFGLHPALAPLHRFYSVAEMLVIPAATTRYRARSRFDGQNMLENGSGIPFGTGDRWLNGAIVNLDQGERRLGLALGPSVPLLLPGRAPVATWADSPLPRTDEDILERLSFIYRHNPLFARTLADVLADGPAGRGREFEISAMAAADLLVRKDGPRIAVMESQGWDTHFGQGWRLAGLFQQLSAGLMTLRRGLGIHWRDKAVVVVSEFGRTAAENGGHAWPLSTTSRGSRSPVSRGLTASRE